MPICDWAIGEEENARVVWNAGTRKAGIEEEEIEEMALKALRRVVDSMVTAGDVYSQSQSQSFTKSRSIETCPELSEASR